MRGWWRHRYLRRGIVAVVVMAGLVFLLAAANSRSTSAKDDGLRKTEDKLRDYFLRARARMNAGDYQEAARYLSVCARIKPDSPRVNYNLAKVYFAMGKKLIAGEYIKKALKKSPKNPEIKKLAQLIRKSKQVKLKTAPPLPEKSLLIYDDHLFFGVTENLQNRRCQARDDYQRKRYGLASRRYDINNYQLFTSEIFFNRAWVAGNVRYPGDLRSYQATGALVFYVRGEQPGINFDIGFQEEENDEQRAFRYDLSDSGPPFATVPLRHYVYTGRRWQRVIIPLSEFGDDGYYMRAFDDQGMELPYEAQHALGFYWKRIGALVQRRERCRGSSFTYWLDEVAVVPSYDQSIYGAAMLAAVELRRQEVPQDFVIFDDNPINEFWVKGDDSAQVVIDETVRKVGKKSLQMIMFEQRGGGDSIDAIDSPRDLTLTPADERAKQVQAGISFPDADFTNHQSYGGIEFYVRGVNGEEHFILSITARNVQHVGKEVRAISPDIRTYASLTTEWKKVHVPFADFNLKRDFDWSRVIRLAFEADPDPGLEWSWYIDDLRIVPKKTFEGDFIK